MTIRPYVRRALLAFFVLCLLVAQTAVLADSQKEALISRVIDGDTFQIQSGEKIRLIGINAPEYDLRRHHIQPYGKEASLFAKENLNGKKVILESDIQKKDKYNRTLAYVYLENGVFVNEWLVSEGYAKARYYAPNGKYYSRLKNAEKKAKEERKGIWKNESKK